MAWTTPVDYTTGQVITSAIWNSLIGVSGNISETAPAKVTTAGDLIYGTASNSISRLGVGSANQLLKVNSGATAPEWGSVAATEMTAGTWKLFYSNATTVVELPLGAANTVLTSAGPSAVPSFAAAAGGGGSVQMTSSGSITAGNAVALSAADTVKEVTDGRVAPVTNTNTTYTQAWSGCSKSSVLSWDGNTTTPTVFASWVSTTGDNWYVQAGTYSSETVTWGTTVEVGAGRDYWDGTNSCEYDSANGGWWSWAGTRDTPYYPYVNFNTVSGTTVTAGTAVVTTEGNSGYYYIKGDFAVDTTNSKTLFAYQPNNTLYLQPFTVSGTTVTIGATRTSPASGYFKSAAVFWNASLARMVLIGCGTSTKLEMGYQSYDSASSSYTTETINGANWIESERNIATVWYGRAGQGFDMGSNRYGYVTNNVQGYCTVTTFTAVDASNGTIGTTSVFDGTTAVASTGTGAGATIQLGASGNFQATYNTTTESLIIFARDAGSATPMRVHSLNYNSSSDMWAEASSTLTVTGDGSGGTDITWNGGAACQLIDSSGNRRAIYSTSNAANAAGTKIFQYLVVTGASGTTDAIDVIGVAQDTVGTGVSVNVSVNGGVNENVTGLTSGSDYYIQGDGSLATTEASPNFGLLGRALATDKLLITGIGDTTVSNQ